MPDPNTFPDPQQPPGGEVRDRSLRPTGLLPKNTQTYVILAIAVIMIGAIAFSGGNASKPASNGQPKTAAVIDPNLARIQDYRNRIDEEAQKLAAEQARLEQTKQALGLPPANQAGPALGGGGVARTSASPVVSFPQPGRPEKSALESEKEKREYQSLFASNIALTYRKDGDGTAELSGVAPQQTSVLPRSTAAAVTPLQNPPVFSSVAPGAVAPPALAAAIVPLKPDALPPGATEAGASASAREPDARPIQREHIDSSLQKAEGKLYRLFEGTIVETVLTNRLEGSFNGPVNCLVTTDVYSHDDQHLLIPKVRACLAKSSEMTPSGSNAWPSSSTGSSCRMGIPSVSINSRD
jgi:type IV secretion system protein VirB10